MTIKISNLLNNFTNAESITSDHITSILSDQETRNGLIDCLIQTPNPAFARYLLQVIIDKRANDEKEIGIEELMYGAYLVGIHQQVEDSLLVWKAKQVDFDAYCGVDIQLVVFAGVDPTLMYLKSLPEEEAHKAVEYILSCQSTGDFDHLDTYFSLKHKPWYI